MFLLCGYFFKGNPGPNQTNIPKQKSVDRHSPLKSNLKKNVTIFKTPPLRRRNSDTLVKFSQTHEKRFPKGQPPVMLTLSNVLSQDLDTITESSCESYNSSFVTKSIDVETISSDTISN